MGKVTVPYDSPLFHTNKGFYQSVLADNWNKVGKVLAVSYRGNVIYELVELTKDDGLKVKMINTIKIYRDLKHGEIGYKYESEDMGPLNMDCPLKFLKASTSQSKYAIEWRENCMQFRASKRRRFV